MPVACVVLLPGIMGSELFLPVSGGRACVWEESFNTIASTILRRPWFLQGHRLLEPGDVFSGYKYGYGHLLDFLQLEGYREPDTLLKFAYDWRQPTQASAQRLCDILRAKPAFADYDFILLGHSMGCVVIRAALPLLAAAGIRVKKIIELAPPHRGASKAFRQLHIFPDVHPLVDAIRSWVARFYSIDERFMHLTRSLHGIWDLLPPDNEPILGEVGSNAPDKCALEWPGWSHGAEVSGEVSRERYTLYDELFLKGPTGLEAALVVGNNTWTEYDYVYEPTAPFELRNFANPTRVLGDGTVAVESAKWLLPLDPSPARLYELDTDHTGIISEPTVHTWIQSQLS